MKEINEIAEEIIAANQDESKIVEILKDNLMLISPMWNIRAVVQQGSEYPSISIFTCSEEGECLDEVAFTEINVKDKKLVSYLYNLNCIIDDYDTKVVHDKIAEE